MGPDGTDDSFPRSLASIRARHPGWSIAAESDVYVAVNRPAQNSQHIVVFDNLPDLDRRLNEIDRR